MDFDVFQSCRMSCVMYVFLCCVMYVFLCCVMYVFLCLCHVCIPVLGHV